MNEIVFFLLFKILKPMLIIFYAYALKLQFWYTMKRIHLSNPAFFNILQTVLPLLQDIDNSNKLINHPSKCLCVTITILFLRTVYPSLLQGLQKQIKIVLVLIEHKEVEVKDYHECIEDWLKVKIVDMQVEIKYVFDVVVIFIDDSDDLIGLLLYLSW